MLYITDTFAVFRIVRNLLPADISSTNQKRQSSSYRCCLRGATLDRVDYQVITMPYHAQSWRGFYLISTPPKHIHLSIAAGI